MIRDSGEQQKDPYMKKRPAVKPRRRPMLHQQSKPNLQGTSNSKSVPHAITTIVNGINNVNPILETFRNKEVKKSPQFKCLYSKKHRIILMGDSQSINQSMYLFPLILYTRYGKRHRLNNAR